MLRNPDGSPRFFFNELYDLTEAQDKERQELSLSRLQYQLITDEHRFIVVATGHRVGLTHALICRAIVDAQTAKNQSIAFVGPTLRHVKQNVWDTLKLAIPRSMVAEKNETELWIKLRYSESTIRLYSAEDEGDRMLGEAFDTVLVENTAEVPSTAWYYAIRPSLSDRKGRAVLASAPHPDSWFRDIFDYARSGQAPDWSAHHYPMWLGDLISQEEIEEAKRQLSPHRFAVEYGAAFEAPNEPGSGMVYFPRPRATENDTVPVPGRV